MLHQIFLHLGRLSLLKVVLLHLYLDRCLAQLGLQLSYLVVLPIQLLLHDRRTLIPGIKGRCNVIFGRVLH